MNQINITEPLSKIFFKILIFFKYQLIINLTPLTTLIHEIKRKANNN